MMSWGYQLHINNLYTIISLCCPRIEWFKNYVIFLSYSDRPWLLIDKAYFSGHCDCVLNEVFTGTFQEGYFVFLLWKLLLEEQLEDLWKLCSKDVTVGIATVISLINKPASRWSPHVEEGIAKKVVEKGSLWLVLWASWSNRNQSYRELLQRPKYTEY